MKPMKIFAVVAETTVIATLAARRTIRLWRRAGAMGWLAGAHSDRGRARKPSAADRLQPSRRRGCSGSFSAERCSLA